jgi:hypothetical protein
MANGDVPAINQSGMDSKDLQKAKTNQSKTKKVPGLNCGNIREPIPHFVKADCETVIPGKNNSYIVLGRDRPGGIYSGYGGKGDTQCGMIDLVVGRMHPTPIEKFKYAGEGDTESSMMVDPMLVPYAPKEDKQNPAPVKFATDAARIYISQKTDIDDNFGLTKLRGIPEGKVKPSINMSGIGIKADAIRIIGNEGIKLITGPDKVNSYGEVITAKGIDLIAIDPENATVTEKLGDGENKFLKRGATMQPLVKGDNLEGCLREISYEIRQIMSTNQKLVNYLVQFLDHYSNHGHPPACPYTPVREDARNINSGCDASNGIGTTVFVSYKRHTKNIRKIESKYLNPQNPKCYIKSKYNNTN